MAGRARACRLLVVAVVLGASAACGGGPGPVGAGSVASGTSGTSATSGTPTSAPASPASASAATPTSSGGVPHFAHIVLVVMENHARSDILGSPDAPFINGLASRGAVFTQSYALTHPSEPNYLALFSGSTQHVTDDSCPHTFAGPDLAGSLIRAGLTFTGYAEGLPQVGFTGCSAGAYDRNHAPWTEFADVPAAAEVPFTAWPADPAALPTVAVVTPDLNHDMHDGTVAEGDAWLRTHLLGYAAWAPAHDSLLVLTWDEDDSGGDNNIATIVLGAHVRTGSYGEHLDHEGVLRTIEDSCGLPALGASAAAAAVTDIWTP